MVVYFYSLNAIDAHDAPDISMWEIEFYERSNGRCPVKEFLDELSPKTQLPYVLRAIDLLAEYGYRLDRPHASYLRDDIYELRVSTRSGNIRVLYFFFLRQKIVLTHGFLKKTGKVRNFEIERAVRYRKDFFERNSGADQ